MFSDFFANLNPDKAKTNLFWKMILLVFIYLFFMLTTPSQHFVKSISSFILFKITTDPIIYHFIVYNK